MGHDKTPNNEAYQTTISSWNTGETLYTTKLNSEFYGHAFITNTTVLREGKNAQLPTSCGNGQQVVMQIQN